MVTKKRPEKSTKGHKKTWKVPNREQKETRMITVGHKIKTGERLGTEERLGTLERKIGKNKRELKKDWKDHKLYADLYTARYNLHFIKFLLVWCFNYDFG